MTTTATQDAQTEAPFGFLMALVVSRLVPMFLGITGGNPALARIAAIETINDYRAQNRASLIAVAQIIAFGLAALGSLSLADADDIQAPMALRLRANANACNRSAEQNRRALQAIQPAKPAEPATTADADFYDTIFQDPEPAPEPPPEPEILLTPAAEELLAAEAAARLQPENQAAGRAPAPKTQPRPASTQPRRAGGNQQAWAIAMAKEADRINANIRHLPPAQRQAASLRAQALSSTASALLGSAPPQPPYWKL
jgi:hypothetical protein